MADVNAAADRLRRVEAGEPIPRVYAANLPRAYDALREDERAVIAARLAEVDPAPVTPDRLAAAGWKESTRYPGLYLFTAPAGDADGYSASLTIRPDGRCLEYSGWLGNNNVRASVVSSMGQLARLVRAMGV